MGVILTLLKMGLLVYGGIGDWKYREIPDLVPIGLFGVSVGELILVRGASLGERLFMLGMVITWILITEFFAAKGKGSPVPGGDIKLLGALAFSEGIFMFGMIILGTGVLVAIVKLADRKNKIDGIPLCTYTAASYGLWLVGSLLM